MKKRAQPRAQAAPISEADVDEFERLQAQLSGLHSEMLTLVKKSPNDPLNKFKLRLVNDVLKASNTLLGDVYRPFSDFDLFSDVELPSNSDVMIILNQYLAAFESMRADHIETETGRWYWVVDGELSDIRTNPPLKLSK